MRSDFAVFIITYKRPDKQLTYSALKSCGYTGKIYFVIDDTDPTIQQYIDNYGVSNIFVFNKNHYINSEIYDTGTNEGVYATALYARNAVEDIAKSLSLSYFAVIDDDMVNFVIRFPKDNKLPGTKIQNMDILFDAYIDILSCGVTCVGFGNARSYFGGIKAYSPERLNSRIIITNLYIRNASKKVIWTSWTLEDDITVLTDSKVGGIWLSIPFVQQIPSPFNDLNNSGGNVELYKNKSRYNVYFTEIKYFPGIMYMKCPDKDTKEVTLVRNQNRCFQKIVSSKYRKENK